MRTALVLQGGGATGSWQAGVLEALLTSATFHQSVVSVIGTSIGGLNGALLVQRLNHAKAASPHAAPVTHKELWENRVSWHLLRRSRLVKLVTEACRPELLTLGPTYLVTTAAVVKGRFRAMTILDRYDMMGPADPGLHIFQFGPTHSSPSGDAVPALLSTSAVPWLYGPVRYRDSWFSDGGLLANLPGDVIKNLNVDAFVVVSPNPPESKLSCFPISRNIQKNMRRRLQLLKDFAAGKRRGAVPVYHLHPGHCDFHPPGMLNFGAERARRSFLNGYEFGHSLLSWTPVCLAQYAV